jgi:hypothetical protein
VLDSSRALCSLYTDEALRKRAAVRSDTGVLRCLHSWWDTALRSQQSLSSDGDGAQPALIKDQYVAMMKKMYRVLVDEYCCRPNAATLRCSRSHGHVFDARSPRYDEEDACACAEDDWEKDARGAVTLSREAFSDALFELADTW